MPNAKYPNLMNMVSVIPYKPHAGMTEKFQRFVSAMNLNSHPTREKLLELRNYHQKSVLRHMLWGRYHRATHLSTGLPIISVAGWCEQVGKRPHYGDRVYIHGINGFIYREMSHPLDDISQSVIVRIESLLWFEPKPIRSE